MIKRPNHWKYPDPCPELEKEFSRQFRIPVPVARALINRGITNHRDAERFLHPSLDYLHSPGDLKGITSAVARIFEALEKGEKITVYGDYDVDGIASAVLLTLALRSLGGEVDYYLPNRFQEGYGLQKEALLPIREKGSSLLITTDCGTNSREEITFARELGIEVIVTDHHQPRMSSGDAVAVINPHQEECSYPWPSLSGTGVVFKLVSALLDKAGETLDPCLYLDLVALGTVADLVPLLDENRILTRQGLELINSNPGLGIKSLLEASGAEKKQVGAHELAFILAPSLNAAGRLGSAEPAAELLITGQEERAREIAGFLRQENLNRRQTEQKILEEARSMVEESPERAGKMVIVLASQGWHQGVIGIVASRLLDLYYRPVVLIALEGGIGKGSARSISGFNITAALQECSFCLERFGGHEQAAGLTVSEENIPQLREKLNQLGNQWLKDEDLFPRLPMEGELDEDEIDQELAFHLEKLAPHGVGNPYPLFCSRGWQLEGWRQVGKDKKHIKFDLAGSKKKISPILFSGAKHLPRLTPGRRIDLALKVANGTWKERSVLNLEIKDLHFVDGEAIEGLEVIDHRNTKERLSYLYQVIPRVEYPLLYAGTGARKNFLEKKLSRHISGEKLLYAGKINGEMTCPKAMVDLFLFHLPVQRDIVEKIIMNCIQSSTLRVHLLYNINDREINRKILEAAFPSLSFIQRLCCHLEACSNPGSVVDRGDLLALEEVREHQGGETLLRRSMSILEEAELVTPQEKGWQLNYSERPYLEEMLADVDSYREACSLMEECSAFQDFMLEASKEEILEHLKRLRKKT